MFNKIIPLTIVFVMFFLCSCSSKDKNDSGMESQTEETIKSETEIKDETVISYKKISAEEAYTMMNESSDFVLLDVRTEEEFEEKRIDGAVLIPDYEISTSAEIELPDKEALIFICCRSGRRSANVANELIEMGYTNVYDFGGIIDWLYETVSG